MVSQPYNYYFAGNSNLTIQKFSSKWWRQCCQKWGTGACFYEWGQCDGYNLLHRAGSVTTQSIGFKYMYNGPESFRCIWNFQHVMADFPIQVYLFKTLSALTFFDFLTFEYFVLWFLEFLAWFPYHAACRKGKYAAPTNYYWLYYQPEKRWPHWIYVCVKSQWRLCIAYNKYSAGGKWNYPFKGSNRLKGTVPRDLQLQVFFMNQFLPSPWVSH